MKSVKLNIILSGMDIAGLLLLLLTFLTWLFSPLVIPLGRGEIVLPWNKLWLFGLVAMLILRMVAYRWANAKQAPIKRAWYPKLLMATGTPFLMLVGIEQVLQWRNYDPPLSPIVFRTGNKLVTSERRTIPDPELLWRFNPGQRFQTKLINSIGVMDREIPPKGSRERRILCFGDSLTTQGQPPFTELLRNKWKDNPPDGIEDWQIFNFGVPGYSSRQGWALFQKVGRAQKPDMVLIWFGWNDHWLFETPDFNRMAVSLPPWKGRLNEFLRKKRFGKWILAHGQSKPPPLNKTNAAGKTFRVPPEEYQALLGQWVDQIRAIQAQPVLITAPRRSLHKRLVEQGYAATLEEAQTAHDQYNEIVRTVAREKKVSLLDLAQELAGPEFDDFFEQDGIHMDDYFLEETAPQSVKQQPGLEWVANRLDRFFRTNVGQAKKQAE